MDDLDNAQANAGAAAAKPGSVEAALERAARETQDALDAYLLSVGDPAIIGPLRQERDEARRALEQYRARRS